MDSFRNLGLSQSTVAAIEKKGYTEPTEIQAKTIPLLLKGEKDVVGQAPTGTGKTASFGLPIIDKLKPAKHVQALILSPTRELALQITKEIETLKGENNIRTLTVYGGASMQTQLQKLKSGIDVVVGTPGRVIDLINRGVLNIKSIQYCVLDEADEMLNMGFVDDIETILQTTPKNKRMLLFSATMPQQIKRIAMRFMGDYEMVTVRKQELKTDLIEQVYYNLNARDRFEALRRIIDIEPQFHGIIFCKTRRDVDDVSTKFIHANYKAGALHGDISQNEREKTLGLFKSKKITVLIATDVAARGIDVNDLTHVINYSLPQTAETYTHRIGRTGRAGKKGTAITFVIPSEARGFKAIERVANAPIVEKKLPKISEVVAAKQLAIENTVDDMLKNQDTSQYNELAKAILSKHSPMNIVSALLQYGFAKDQESYKEISVPGKESRKDRNRGRSFGRGRDDRRSGKGFSDRRDGRGNRDSFSDRRGRDNKRQGGFSRNKPRRSDDDGQRNNRGFNKGNRDKPKKNFGGGYGKSKRGKE